MRSKSKFVLLLVAVLGFMFWRSSAFDAGDFHAEWLTDMDVAVQQAESEGKQILVNFSGSDWCYYCKKIDAEVFTQKAFVEYAEKNLVLLLIDFPRNKPLPEAVQVKNEALAQKFKVKGFPSLFLLDKTGHKLKQISYSGGGPDAFLSKM